ncbi:MAG: Holliday junction resolvase RuvX [Candidatus Binatia bacterium]
MKRKGGLDIGERRIGVAVTDPLEITAQPLGVVTRQSWKKDIAGIMELLKDYEVDAFVVGLPLTMKGEEGEQADRVKHFCKHLETETGLAVFFQDERLTSVQSERAMIEAGMSRRKRRNNIDKTAAALILQAWIDGKR